MLDVGKAISSLQARIASYMTLSDTGTGTGTGTSSAAPPPAAAAPGKSVELPNVKR